MVRESTASLLYIDACALQRIHVVRGVFKELILAEFISV